MSEEKKPMNVTQQKESQGKERSSNSKSPKDNYLKEIITVQRVN